MGVSRVRFDEFYGCTMLDQFFDRTLYILMAAVLVIPEPATFLVCMLMLAGIVAHIGSQILVLLRIDEPAAVVPSVKPAEELVAA